MYEGTRIGQGRENAKRFLIDNPEMAATIEQAIKRNTGKISEALLATPDAAADDDM